MLDRSCSLVLTRSSPRVCLCLLFATAGCLPENKIPQSTDSIDGIQSATEKRTLHQNTQKLTILTDAAARREATRFLNETLRKQKFMAPSGETSFPNIDAQRWEHVTYDYQKERIMLRFGGFGGWEAIVSLSADGSNPKLEHAEFAWD